MISISPRASSGRVRLAVALALALVAAVLVSLGARRRNLALGKPVTASSVRLGDPAGVVNGFVEYGGYALHTKTEAPAWVRIDLGASHPIGEVRLYPRGDGYLDERGAQIAIDLSEDGAVYRRAGDCTELFSQLAPCVVRAGGAQGRYVLVRHTSVLVLSEVEVRQAR